VLGACRLTGPPELLEARKETGNISLAAAAAAAAAAESLYASIGIAFNQRGTQSNNKGPNSTT
jgi:hypothetical protein